MSKTVTIKNISSEPLAFTGFPMIEPEGTIEVSEKEAELLLLNSSVQLVEKETKASAKISSKDASFKGVEQ